MNLDMKKPKVVTINPDKWGRHTLYNSKSGNYCALGFLAHSAGVPVETLDAEKVYGWLRKEGISPRKIYKVNDDIGLSYSERRTKLKALFKEAGIRLLFSDERRKARLARKAKERYVIRLDPKKFAGMKYVTAALKDRGIFLW